MVGLPKSLIKKYGITKKAWSIFRGSKPKTRSKTMAKRKSTRKVYVKSKRKGYSKPRGLFGGFGKGLTLKSIAVGAGGLVALQKFPVLGFAGAYKSAADKIAIGVIGPMLGADNHDMLTVGIKEGLATFVGGFLGGSQQISVGGTSL